MLVSAVVGSFPGVIQTDQMQPSEQIGERTAILEERDFLVGTVQGQGEAGTLDLKGSCALSRGQPTHRFVFFLGVDRDR